MKKNKCLKSSIILIIGGLLTKFLGMFVKIILTRSIGSHGMGLYSMIMPTFLLLISISGFGLTTALNVLISSNKYNNKNIIITSLIISLSIDFIIFILLFIFSGYISNNLLNNEILKIPLLSIGFVLPFITVSNIFRIYYFSKERMLPHVISNIIEDLIKLLLIYFFMKYFSSNEKTSLSFLILINIFSELSSIIIFIHCFPNFTITYSDIKPNKKNIKDILSISIPTTISRLINSITYFLEPIILTYTLTKIGYSNNYIVTEYGIINGYVLPILLLPSFLTNAISQALIPSISKNYSNKNYIKLKKGINQALYISLILGIIFTLIFTFSGKLFLNLLYKTDEGINYIRFLAPIFIFHYLEHPLLSSLQAMNKSKTNLKISIYNFFIRTIGLASLCILKINMYGLLITLSLNMIFTCIYSWNKINKILEI